MPIQKVFYDKSIGMRVPVKIWTNDIEPGALEQAMNAASLPFIRSHVSLMPDTHQGYGVPIGAVVPCDNVIIPNCVGVDIGCGMCAYPLGTGDLPDVDDLFQEITENIPTGFHSRSLDTLQEGIFRTMVLRMEDQFVELMEGIQNQFGDKEILQIMPKNMDIKKFAEKLASQYGTLGGGNHFLELQRDETGMLWFMVHSGSRGFGAMIANHFHKVAQKVCEKYHSYLPTPDLAYLPLDSEEGQKYFSWMNFAMQYALQNREMMMRIAYEKFKDLTPFGMDFDIGKMININHNYAAMENHFGENVLVHRKGATLARDGTIGIIPGSMCTHSYIVRGLGNPDSMNSCSHGSGRNFSRTEAKRRVDQGTDLDQPSQLGNVRLYGATDVRDELGSAYKNVEDVMQYQNDLVEITHKMTPIAVLKGGGKDD